MTTFEHQPGDYYRMQTLIPGSAADSLMSMRDLGTGSLTEGVRRVVGAHQWYEDAHTVGNLLVAVSTEAIEPLAPSAFTPDEERAHTKATLNVNPDTKAYLDRYVTGESEDLVQFWGSATDFYGKVMERVLLGQKLYRITPKLAMAQVTFPSPFGESPQPPSGRGRKNK